MPLPPSLIRQVRSLPSVVVYFAHLCLRISCTMATALPSSNSGMCPARGLCLNPECLNDAWGGCAFFAVTDNQVQRNVHILRYSRAATSAHILVLRLPVRVASGGDMSPVWSRVVSTRSPPHRGDRSSRAMVSRRVRHHSVRRVFRRAFPGLSRRCCS